MKQVKITAIIAFGVLIVACHHAVKTNKATAGYEARTYQTGSQFGYDIYKDSARIIHQPIIPGVEGNRGFATKQDAQKVADLMIYKLSNGIMPPSITVQELDSLKVLNN